MHQATVACYKTAKPNNYEPLWPQTGSDLEN